MLDHYSTVPRYMQLANLLRQQIESGEIRPGEKLPSESEMMQTYHIGRPTVRAALKELVDVGLLVKMQGKGTFCRGERKGSAYNIEVLLDMENEYFIPYYVRAISSVLQENGCNFLIGNTNRNAESICQQLEQFLQKDTTGVILQMTPVDITPETRQRLISCFAAFHRRNIPLILIDSQLDGAEISFCAIDDCAGGARAAEHLAAYGHRRCAMLGPSDLYDARQRYEGFCASAERFRMEPPTLLACGENIEQTLPGLLRDRGITGIFCYNDAIAQRCIRALAGAGYQVPEQISVIGFDDSFLAAAIEPPLTTLCHPKEELGRHTAAALLQLIRGELQWPYRKMFQVSLVQRETCGICRHAVHSAQ